MERGFREILTTSSLRVEGALARRKYGDQHNPLAKILPNNSWLGQPCFIIGGGPSLTGFDFNRLAGSKVIGINRVFEFYPAADINYAMDLDFFVWIQRIRSIHWEAYLGLKVWLDLVSYPFSENIFTVNGLGETGIPIDLKEGIYHGANSGYGAIQIAYLLGADPIYLLGYDMQFKNGKIHFYPGGKDRPREHVYKGFIPAFEDLAARLPVGRVINLNPDSAITGFLKQDPDQILGRS